jgi:hypothetical protein
MAAEVTIGANVNQSITREGTCAAKESEALLRPCTIVTTVIPGQTMSAPCNGTVTRFRLNGFVKPANHYSLRVVRRNPDASFTGTATSPPVAIATDGAETDRRRQSERQGQGQSQDHLHADRRDSLGSGSQAHRSRTESGQITAVG